MNLSFDAYRSFAVWPTQICLIRDEDGKRTTCGRSVPHSHAQVRSRRTVPVDRMCRRCLWNLLRIYLMGRTA